MHVFHTGAFLFEDVGVTAFHGAIPLLKNNTILNLIAGIAPVEAYHAAILRTLLYQKGSDMVTPYQIRVFDFVQVTAHWLPYCLQSQSTKWLKDMHAEPPLSC